MIGGRRITDYLQGTVFLLAGLAAWEMVCRIASVPVWLLPSPSTSTQRF